jgi:hypothetical protein
MILGPVLFNIFFNDIFNFVEESILYNYADNNTLSYSERELNKVVDVLEKESLNLIRWFSHNQMKANPNQFQAIAIGSKTSNESISFNLDGNKIDCEKEVKLMGVTKKSDSINPPFLWKCLYQVRAIVVFPVFRLLTDFVCLLTYEFCLSFWKFARCLVILLLPLFILIYLTGLHMNYYNLHK